MPKKTTKKKQYVWGWAATNTSGKPSDAEKAKVTAAFAPWVQQLKNEMPHVAISITSHITLQDHVLL